MTDHSYNILLSPSGDAIISKPTSASAFFLRSEQVRLFLQDPTNPPLFHEINGYGNIIVQIMAAAEATFREVKPPSGSSLCLRYETPSDIVVVYSEDAALATNTEWLDELQPHLFVSKTNYLLHRLVGTSIIEDFGWGIFNTASQKPEAPPQLHELSALAATIRSMFEKRRSMTVDPSTIDLNQLRSMRPLSFSSSVPYGNKRFDKVLRVPGVQTAREALFATSHAFPACFAEAERLFEPCAWQLLYCGSQFPWSWLCDPSTNAANEMISAAQSARQIAQEWKMEIDCDTAHTIIRSSLSMADPDAAKAAWLVLSFSHSLHLSPENVLRIEFWQRHWWKTALQGYTTI